MSDAAETSVSETPDHNGMRAPSEVPLWRGLIKLARPTQWSKSVFVAIGPAYWLMDETPEEPVLFALRVFMAGAAFALASSMCYVHNDLADVEEDRNHPRKCRRPIASGVVPEGVARVYMICLGAAAALLAALLPSPTRWVVGVMLLIYVLNVMAYSARLKRIVIADVMSLSFGFVIRVFGGCAAISIAPTTWLLNVVLFLSMTLAIGKRLGERRTMGDDVLRIRGVQKQYSDDLLRMALVVTAVGTLLTYAGYVTTREADFTYFGFNWLWLTLLPAMFALLRAILLLEHGQYDDPTELAIADRQFQCAAGLFGAITLTLWLIPHA